MPATFDRLGGFSGGASLDEPPLPASSLTRNTRNTWALPLNTALGAKHRCTWLHPLADL